jgi:hypothetical protein
LLSLGLPSGRLENGVTSFEDVVLEGRVESRRAVHPCIAAGVLGVEDGAWGVMVSGLLEGHFVGGFGVGGFGDALHLQDPYTSE